MKLNSSDRRKRIQIPFCRHCVCTECDKITCEGRRKRAKKGWGSTVLPCMHNIYMRMLENIVEASGKFSTDFVMTKLFTRSDWVSEEIMFLRFYNPVVSLIASHSCNISKHVRLQHIELTYVEVVRIVVETSMDLHDISQMFIYSRGDEKLFEKINAFLSLDNKLVCQNNFHGWLISIHLRSSLTRHTHTHLNEYKMIMG